MLKPPATIEDSLPVFAPVAAGLVINDAELRRTDLVDAIDASGDAERQAAAKIDVDRLGAGELLTLLLTVGNHRSPERHLEPNRFRGGGFALRFEEEIDFGKKVAALALEDLRRRGRHLLIQSVESVL